METWNENLLDFTYPQNKGLIVSKVTCNFDV